MSKNALILGIGGQDGSLLADLLLKHKYRVYGTVRENIDFNNDSIVVSCVNDYIVDIK